MKTSVGNMEILKKLKTYGFADSYIARNWNMTEKELYDLRQQHHIVPVSTMVDT